MLQVQTIFIRSMSNPFLFKSNAPIDDIEAEVTNMAARQEKEFFIASQYSH